MTAGAWRSMTASESIALHPRVPHCAHPRLSRCAPYRGGADGDGSAPRGLVDGAARQWRAGLGASLLPQVCCAAGRCTTPARCTCDLLQWRLQPRAARLRSGSEKKSTAQAQSCVLPRSLVSRIWRRCVGRDFWTRISSGRSKAAMKTWRTSPAPAALRVLGTVEPRTMKRPSDVFHSLPQAIDRCMAANSDPLCASAVCQTKHAACARHQLAGENCAVDAGVSFAKPRCCLHVSSL